MNLTYYKRAADKKSTLNKIRREGNVPASIYIKGSDAETITVKGNEFSSHLRAVRPGFLPTAIFSLVDADGKVRKAVIKDIQYHPTTYQVLHLDFEELLDNVQVNVKVPIEFTGEAESQGIKLGGALRRVIRHVRVRCFPKDIPSFFTLDVRDLGERQARRLKDIQFPDTIRPLADLNEVAAVIVKR